MATYTLPYWRTSRPFSLPDRRRPHLIALAPHPGVTAPELAVATALDDLLGNASWRAFAGARTVAIAINDKTRPVPHQHLLPPLLQRLEALGLPPERITLLIATGTHPPLTPAEFPTVVPQALLDRYPVRCHDADEAADLVFLGATSRGTPVWINRHFVQADLRIVVGNIEPHQFQGFSGGIKSAAIGLAGRATVNDNHALMTDAHARLGEVAHNPARQDVEEIGARIGVHLALNAILNDQKAIVHVLAGAPDAVLAAGIPLSTAISRVAVPGQFDLVIASPGGHPKDINVYQAQKGLAHASLVTRTGGTVILAAACPEGTGSRGYEQWVGERRSHADVLARFAEEGFRVGPHKAFQIARDAVRVHVALVSDMPPELVHRLLLTPAADLQTAVDRAVSDLPPTARIAIMPRANATIPLIDPPRGAPP